ncbi:MAG: sigma-70 family RNA polymerase sigma factor [Acidobacteriota bacterium]
MTVAELERHHPKSFGWALACCRGDRSEAEEVLQVAYMKILDGSARFNARSQFKTWLFAVIRLTAQEHRRRAFLRRLIEDRAQRWRDQVEQPAVPAIEADSEKVEALRLALGELSRRQQEVINLVFYQDLSVAEAAEVMKVSVGSASRHYERGKKRLLVGLEARGVCK